MILDIFNLDGYTPVLIEQLKIFSKTLLKMLLTHLNICMGQE